MMAKPMKSLELHYPMIQFLISANIRVILVMMNDNIPSNEAPKTNTKKQRDNSRAAGILFIYVHGFHRCNTRFQCSQANS